MQLPSPSFSELIDLPTAYYAMPDDAKLRYAVLEPEGTPRGTVLVAQGRREFIEKKYVEVGCELYERGYRVILFDWRGMGLSSRVLSDDRWQRDHLTDFEMLIDDLRAFHRDIVKPRQSGPLIVFAHSLGALVTTRWLGDNAPDVAGVVMTAPALAIGVPFFSYAVSRLMIRLKRSENYAVGQHDYGGLDRTYKGNVLSHDQVRYGIIEKYFDAKPDYRVGGVTWGWLAAVLRAIKRLHDPGYLENIKTPVLALCCGQDIVTPPTKSIPLLRRLPHCDIVTVQGARHDLMNEAEHYRQDAWRHIDGFLSRASTR